jgi:lipopolysaccharide biosynthesis glycosyltransferase
MTLRVYVGYDPRELEAYHVAVASLLRRTRAPVCIVPLERDRLQAQGLLTRTADARGQQYDLASQAPQSTEFAISRFLVPMLAQTGPALFIDCDVLLLGDVQDLFDLWDPRYAVQVVKHRHAPLNATKMDGAQQTRYPRKNWSSVVLWSCDHYANDRLSLWDVNHRAGRDLHRFYWLADDEIGELPPAWNWLVNEQQRPADAKLAHYTNGGPWFADWAPQPHDALWLEEYNRGN